jgi:hypothetical protein
VLDFGGKLKTRREKIKQEMMTGKTQSNNIDVCDRKCCLQRLDYRCLQCRVEREHEGSGLSCAKVGRREPE